MRKNIFIIVCAAVLLAGCGNTSAIDKLIEDSEVELTEQDKLVASQAEQAALDYLLSSEAQFTADSAARPQSIEGFDPSNGDIDVDLTALDANMTYAYVFAMINEPEEYLGKTVRAEGTLAHTVDNGKDYFAVFIKDATACCAQGMEFELEGEHTFPEDYPAVDSDIVVEGIFTTYEENGYTYCNLADAHFVQA